MAHELDVCRNEPGDVVILISAFHRHVVRENCSGLMATYGDALHDLLLGSGFLELGFAVNVLRKFIFQSLPSPEVATAGDEPIIETNTRHIVYSSNVSPTLFSQASSCDAVGAPISVRHVGYSVFCYVCGARADWTDCDFQISGFFFGLDFLDFSPHLLFRLDAGLLRRGYQNISITNLSRADGAVDVVSCGGLMRDTWC